MSFETKKLIVIGDGICGKTCLLTVFSKGEFPEEYVPTVFENTSVGIELEGRKLELNLWDTAGQEEYDRVRRLFYGKTDVVVLCFSVDNRVSFKNIKSKWAPELNRFCGGVPIVLVANKIDLRDGEEDLVTPEEGQLLAKKIKAFAYLENSAKMKIGVQEVFVAAAIATLQDHKNKKCSIL